MTPARRVLYSSLSQRHLLGIEGLSHEIILGLLDLAEELDKLNRQIDKKGTCCAGAPGQPVLRGVDPLSRRSSTSSGSAPT